MNAAEGSAPGAGAADARSRLKNLTHRPGAYQMLDAKRRVIYVGKAKDLRRRGGS